MEDTIVETTKLASNIISCITRGLSFTIIVYLTTQYFKAKSNHRSAYYVILNVGYAIDFVLFVNWLLPLPSNTYIFFSIILEWYIVYFTTIWNVVLCLNRCTALAFFAKYDRIWRPLTMFFIFNFMIAFPFIIDASGLFTSNCEIKDFLTCLNFRKTYYLKGTIVNGILNGAGILFIAICLYKSSNDKFKVNSAHAKTERRLIFQAIFSSILQLISFALKYSTATNSNLDIFLTIMYFSDIVYHFQHLGVMVTHFILSPSFKMAYLEFYHLTFLLGKRRTNVVTIKSTNTKSFTPSISVVTIM